MGMSRYEKIDIIVAIDPVKDYNMPYKEKYGIGQAVGCINWAMRGKNKKMLLLAPRQDWNFLTGTWCAGAVF